MRTSTITITAVLPRFWVKVDADTTSTTANKGAITLGGDTLTADSDGAISLTGSADNGYSRYIDYHIERGDGFKC